MTQACYTLTQRADADLEELTQWSLTRWGAALTDHYLDDLHSGLEWIARHTSQVVDRPHLTVDTGLSIYPIREHYVIFLPTSADHIVIVAFLRQGRDIPAILSKNSATLKRDIQAITKHLKSEEIALPSQPKRTQ